MIVENRVLYYFDNHDNKIVFGNCKGDCQKCLYFEPRD